MTDQITLATVEKITLAATETRLEHDLLCDEEVPNSAYWGIHTKRAFENFPISGVPVGHFPDFFNSLALV